MTDPNYTLAKDMLSNTKSNAGWALHQANESLALVRKNHIKGRHLNDEQIQDICTLITVIDRSVSVMKNIPRID